MRAKKSPDPPPGATSRVRNAQRTCQTSDSQFGEQSQSRPHPAHARRRGSGVTSLIPLASSTSVISIAYSAAIEITFGWSSRGGEDNSVTYIWHYMRGRDCNATTKPRASLRLDHPPTFVTPTPTSRYQASLGNKRLATKDLPRSDRYASLFGTIW